MVAPRSLLLAAAGANVLAILAFFLLGPGLDDGQGGMPALALELATVALTLLLLWRVRTWTLVLGIVVNTLWPVAALGFDAAALWRFDDVGATLALYVHLVALGLVVAAVVAWKRRGA